ncbi:MAG: hypothetical protein R6U78_06605 [Bacteroidales bacterium]
MDLPDIQLSEQLWKYLVIAALILAVLALIMMVVVALRFSRIIKGMKKKQWTNQKIVEKRMDIYDRMAPRLNDIYCFYCYVGKWKEITPPDILRIKRDLDKEMNIYSRLFSDDLSEQYRSFMLLCFVSKTGWEHDEKIKSLYELRKEQCTDWDDNWIQYFDTNNVVEGTKIKERYDELTDSFKNDLVVLQYGDYPGISELGSDFYAAPKHGEH